MVGTKAIIAFLLVLVLFISGCGFNLKIGYQGNDTKVQIEIEYKE